MKHIRFFIYFVLPLALSVLLSTSSCAQLPATRPHVESATFDKMIGRTISFSVPTMGVAELKATKEPVYLLDAREVEEYEVSHIPNAIHVGYDHFDATQLAAIPKDAKVVLYCSIGYRSEKIGEQVAALGYTNVHNLYGSIFEWVNQGNTVVDNKGQATQKVHTYNRVWSVWVDGAQAEKVW